jgi:hypothetical protein
MITVSYINDSIELAQKKANIDKALKETFKYVNYGEIDVVFDIISPTSSLGNIDLLFFVNIENHERNYYRTYPSRNYLHTLVVGVKKIILEDVVDADSECFFNEEGSWNYIDSLMSEGKAFDSFCYSISNDVKYFKSAFFFYVEAPNCKKSFNNQFAIFNKSIHIPSLIDFASQRCRSGKSNDTWSIQLDHNIDIHHFISIFIDETEKKSMQGILTKKKVDAIHKDSVLIERILNSIGSRLCIIRGNAGAGKTLSLMRIAYRIVSREFDKEGEKRSHNVRLLTYNNMLVFDIRNTIKSMGSFSSSNLSVQTLHKFFYEIFKRTPVVWAKYSGHMIERINDLMNTCSERIDIANSAILESYKFLGKKEKSPYSQIEKYQKHILNGPYSNDEPIIKEADRKEANLYFDYLTSNNLWDDINISDGLDEMKCQYIKKKKQLAIDNYLNSVFLTDYESILKDIYFFSADPKKFYNDHNIKSKRDFFQFVSTTDIVDDDTLESFVDNSLVKMKRMVKWSHAFLIDEAQDCSIYEKALLYQTRGSENIVITTGGKDQMIRKPKENDWTVLFGKQIEKETITLRKTSYRQKANIVLFLNEFAKKYNLDTKNLEIAPETKGKGHVIIDTRYIKPGELPLDIIASLRNQGKDYGCSDYENIMAFLPHKGYTTSKNINTHGTQNLSMNIDITDTITFSELTERGLNDLGEKNHKGTEDIRICDCTISSKGDINPGQCDTRFLYYDSCRGLEAWNVMCLRLDDFYYEKLASDEAKNYAIEMSGLIHEDRSMFERHYSAIWCYMAFTRPMDTLYISLTNTNSEFSKELLEIAKKCGDAVDLI